MATLPEYRRFTRVNLPVWVIVGAAVLWGVVSKLQGKFVLSWGQMGLLIALALVSAAARTWVGLKDPRVMYRLTLPLVLFDLVLITLATRFTGGFESQIWLLYFALLTSEAAVMPTRLLLLALGLAAVGYGWASAPLAPDQWNDFGFRIAAVSLVSWLIHQIYRSHAEYRMELAELREQYDLAQERERIAREFHDGLGHHLVSAIRGLESIRRRLKAHADTAADCALQEQIDILRAALDDTRQTIQQLRAPETTDMRVFIRQTAERVAQRLGAQLHCDCPDAMPTLTPLQTLMLMRVMQEALSNVLKHAGRPQNLWVACDWRDGWLEMRVADDGDGFDPAAVLEGMGLNNMRERIRALGGELTITSAPEQGTTVLARVPIQQSDGTGTHPSGGG
ncbi:MAG: sensor histidine kinase [Armatimonadota bacterium]|nr:sensor histidine kinase [Armatimonadota bacterium]